MRWIPVAAIAAFVCFSAAAVAVDPRDAAPREQQFRVQGVAKADRFEMTARGTLVVEPDGRVSEVELDMPMPAREPYLEAIARWTFKPVEVDGRVVRAKAHFALDAVGEIAPGSENVRFAIEDVRFLDPPGTPSGSVLRSDFRPPAYPPEAAREGVGAKILVLLRVDDEGRVLDAAVDRMQLGASLIRDPGRASAHARRLARATLRAASEWVVRDPEAIARGSVVVPVTFAPPQIPFNGWQPRIPVEVTSLPWMLPVRGEAIVMGPSGERPSTAFRLIEDVAGTAVN